MNINKDKTEMNDDEDISILIRESAINKKTPGLFSDSKNIEEIIRISKFKEFKKNIIECFDDFIVSKMEAYRLSCKKGSSDRAIKETMDYYRSLYISKNPDLDKLYRLIQRNKVIDFPNQYPFGTQDYFEYHESGTLAMEINTILSHVVNKQESVFDESEKEKIKISRTHEWMTLEEANASNFLEEEENDKIRYELALQSWVLIVSYTHDVDYLKRNIHPDNIELATIDCLMNFPENKYADKQKFISGIKRLNIADEKIINGILNKKEQRKINFNNREKMYSEVKSVKNDFNTKSVNTATIPSLKQLKDKRNS